MNTDADALWALWRPTCAYIHRQMPDAHHEDIEDMAGEVILRTMTADRQLDDRPNALRNYVLAIARNLVIDRQRRQGRVYLVPLERVDWEIGRVSVGSDRHAAVIDLRDEMDRLSPRAQHAVTAWTDGYGTRDAADALGCTPRAIKSLNHRTRHGLRQALEVGA